MTVDRVTSSTTHDVPDGAAKIAPKDRVSSSDAPRSLTRFAPAIFVALIASVALTAYGVAVPEVARFATYWTVCLVVPGMLITRALVGTADTLTEDVALGALAGLAIEAVAFVVLDALGLHDAIRWWWVIVYAAFAVLPQLRGFWRVRPVHTSPSSWSWAMSAASLVGILFATRSFRARELAPAESAPYVDHLFHLSLVNEMTRQGPHEVPQVAGEPLAYHVFSHAHMANVATITDIGPDVVLSRLWMIPVIVLTVVLLGILAHRVTRSIWAGPVAVWLSIAALLGNSIWTDRSNTIVSPIAIVSPSQVFANPVFIGGCLAFVGVLRSARPWRWSLLFILFAAAGVGAKPTVVPILFGGAVLTIGSIWFLQRRIPAPAATSAGALLVIQFGWLLISPPIEGKITILGSIDSLPVFREVNGSSGLRAVSETLLLDRLDDGRAWLAAGIAVLWLAAVQAVRLLGLGTLLTRETRRDPVAWWLAGTYAAGWGAFFVIDQAGFSQAYFALTAIPAGAVLSCWFLATVLDRVEPGQRGAALGAGLAFGASTALIVRGAVAGRSASTAYGPVESALLPVLLALVAGTTGIVLWRAWGRRPPRSATVIGVAFVLGLSLPSSVGEISRLVGSLLTETATVDETSAGFVSAAEAEAMSWLSDNTPADAVVVTNSHCRPLDAALESCDARSFVVSGFGGRRVVLEGWAYTPEAQALHGTDGRSFALQPSPWPDRLSLSQAALTAPDAQVLGRLVDQHGAGWIVGFRRAGPVSDDLDDFADVVFANGAVEIYRLRSDS